MTCAHKTSGWAIRREGSWAALFQDLCALGNQAPATLLDALGDVAQELRGQLEKSNAITTVLEPSFADFGSPDGLIILRSGAEPVGALLMQAKRGPLATEWTASVTKPNGGRWESSHLVVQTARSFAFADAVSRRAEETRFTSTARATSGEESKYGR